MAYLKLKVMMEPEGRIGPGKIELLEQIAAFGSISAGARNMKMSYKRAWDLIEEMNRMFGRPVVEGQAGGRQGGGAQLTGLGLSLISRFRAIERAAEAATERMVNELQAEVENS